MPAHDFTRVKPNIYHCLHGLWISQLISALNRGILPKPYYALPELDDGEIRPDVTAIDLSVSEEPGRYGLDFLRLHSILPPAATFVVQTSNLAYGLRRKTIVICEGSDREIVAFLELLSNANKSSPAKLNKFVEKVTNALDSRIHVSVVDPYPPNKHAPQGIHGAIWVELGEDPGVWSPDTPLTSVAYASGTEIKAYVRPYGLGDAIPDVPLFLKPDYHVLVPLEATYMEAFYSLPEPFRELINAPAQDERKP